MKSVLRFFPALLAVWPYGILCIGLFEEGSAGSMVFLWVYCGLTAALLLFQILYCCLHRASARTFAFWNLTVKLCHIPFYLAVFALGVLMTMAMVVPALLFVSPMVNLMLLAVDTALMLTSSAYGIRAAVSGVREGELLCRARRAAGRAAPVFRIRCDRRGGGVRFFPRRRFKK